MKGQMIGYVTVGTNDLERAKQFYDNLFGELGATDEGPPGERMPTFYGAYIRDLDGNKLVFYKMTTP